MLPDLELRTVTRLRGQPADNGYGDSVIDWTDPDRLDIDDCSFQPKQGEEILTDRSAVISRWRWFGPSDADVKSADRIEVDGITYDIDGSVQNPRGLGLDHKTAMCRRADG